MKFEASIIIPMRNAEPFILQTLNSVLQEKRCNIEIIVINDQSTDLSAAIVSALLDPRIKIIEGPGQGISACFNSALAHVRGEIIMRCDADDLYSPERINKQVQWLKIHPEFDAVCGKFAIIDEKGKFVRELGINETSCEITEELCSGVTRTHFCTFAIRTKNIQELGGFRNFFVTGEDIDLQLRLGENSRVWFNSDICYYYRLHNSSIIHQQHDSHRQFYEDMARHFQKQRQHDSADALEKGAPPPIPDVSHHPRSISGSMHVQNMLFGRAWHEHSQGHKMRALKTGLAALGYQPMNGNAWKNLLTLIVKSLNQPTGKK